MVQLRAVVVVLAMASAACGGSPSRAATDPAAVAREGGAEPQADACTGSGGTVTTAQCCGAAGDSFPGFPNTCLIGACGCSPEHSVPRRVCACPEGACFDGSRCVAR